MRTPLRAGITTIVLAGGTVLGVSDPVQAADSVLYVRPQASICSDTGPGSQEQPFCTIGAAAAMVTAGQTVELLSGNYYNQNLTVSRSGTADQPITFRVASGTFVTMSGPEAGILIDGHHDIRLENLGVVAGVDVPALDIRNSSAITVDGGSYSTVRDPATSPAIRLSGVTVSTLKRISINGRTPAGLLMDATTSGVTVDAASAGGGILDNGAPGAGIVVDGPGNKVLDSRFEGWSGAAILVSQGATDTLVVNNEVTGGPGIGIHNNGARGTIITNNTVKARCEDGIRVDGPSSGVSVHNSLLEGNGTYDVNTCTGAPVDGVDLGVYDGGVADTVADYNNTRKYTRKLAYAWNGTKTDLAGFQAASGQGAHDREILNVRENIDSANSAAPGYPATDRVGNARIDDPAIPNTGAGPVPYADRGALETAPLPVPRSIIALDLAAASVTVDASASEPGITPIAFYEFDFGDGAIVKQTSPLITHRFANTGQRAIRTTVIGTDGRPASRSDLVDILPAQATIGLLSLPLLKYAGARPEDTSLVVDQTSLTADAQFDLADAGSGQVALLHRGTGKYASADHSGAQVLLLQRLTVGETERFTIIRNAEGSISLKSVASGRYLSLVALDNPFLIASGTAIGEWEKFYEVKTTDAARTLKSAANGKYVSAEQAGTQPLIASRPAADLWEQFDIVDLGGGKVALFARVNNRFVAAESNGAKPLLAGRFAVSTWETFTLIRNSDGTVSFKAAANNLYVCAERAGAQPLIASRPAISTWEKYTLN